MRPRGRPYDPGHIILDTELFFSEAEKDMTKWGFKTIMEAYMLTILHELGHATGALDPLDFLSDDIADKNDRIIVDACFKD